MHYPGCIQIFLEGGGVTKRFFWGVCVKTHKNIIFVRFGYVFYLSEKYSITSVDGMESYSMENFYLRKFSPLQKIPKRRHYERLTRKNAYKVKL